MDKAFTGDLDELVKRRAIRVAVTFNRTHYFIDRGQERGLTYEWMKIFEDDLNKDLKTGKLKVHVVMVPMSREQLYPALTSGKVDMVAAMLTVTPEREKLVAFSEPTRTNVSEVVVTGRERRRLLRWTILRVSGVSSRKGSSTRKNLVRLSAELKARGIAPDRDRRGTDGRPTKTMTCSKCETPVSPRSPSWTTFSPNSVARWFKTITVHRTSRCGPGHAGRGIPAKRIRSS
jgi:membrane-bound lytic murein transglycosylase MltF